MLEFSKREAEELFHLACKNGQMTLIKNLLKAKVEINAWNCFIWFYRSPNQFCTGTDLNRNWGYHWNDGGSSSNPCTDTYMGKSAFSEIENQNVRDFLSKHKDTIMYYVNLHSYSQLVLLPWGYTEEPMPVYDRYLEVANKVWIYFTLRISKIHR